MTKDPLIYLEHIIDSIVLIEEYVAGLDYSQFSRKTEKQDAVLRRLGIIGEAG